MKTSTKTLIAFIIIAVIGLGVAISGAFIEKEYFIDMIKSIEDPTYGYNRVEYVELDGQEIKDIQIFIKTAKITVISGEKFNLLAETKSTDVEQRYENGTFHYTENLKNRPFFLPHRDNRYTLTVPKGREVKLTLNNASGDIELKDYDNYGDIKLDIKSGDVECNGINANKIEIFSLSGDIELTRVVAKDMKLSASSGNIAVKDTAIENQLIISQKSGKTVINQLKTAVLALECISGGVEVDNITAEKSMKIKTVSGKININNSTISDIDLQTSSGNVIIRLNNSLINIKANSTSGNIKYDGAKQGSHFDKKQENARHTLAVVSTSGNIEIYT